MSYLGNMKSILLYRSKERGKGGDYSILRSINEEEENDIDENDVFVFFNGDIRYSIPKKDIYFYGEIDVDNPSDIDIIKKYKLVDLDMVHSWVPSQFDYKTATGSLKKSYPTCDPVLWFKYCHCRIGKPKRVIAYKINEKLLGK